MPKLTFYTHPMSRGRTVRWMLEECGATYETVPLEYGSTMKAPEYLAINPMGKVPAIRHNDTVITETAAICAYLADLLPLRQLAPSTNNPERGSYYRWLFFAAGVVEPAAVAKSMGLLAPEDKRLVADYGSFDDVMRVLEMTTAQAVKQGGYLCARHFTAADLYLASQLDWGMRFGTIDKRQAFADYIGPLLQRPAKQTADALDDALLTQMPQKE